MNTRDGPGVGGGGVGAEGSVGRVLARRVRGPAFGAVACACNPRAGGGG